MNFKISNDESKNFGFSVARSEITKLSSIRKLDNLCKENKIKLLITRVLSNSNKIRNELFNYNHIYLEQLNFYSLSIHESNYHNIKNNENIQILKRNELFIIEELLNESFRDYKSHFTKDSKLNNNFNFYFNWVFYEFNNNNLNNYFITYKLDKKIVGFCMIGIDNNFGLIAKLYAVHPKYRRRGVFNDLLTFTILLGKNLKKFDNKKIIYSTQDDNLNVINILLKFGFNLDYSIFTFHKWYEHD